jgi:hypothetical protein
MLNPRGIEQRLNATDSQRVMDTDVLSVNPLV